MRIGQYVIEETEFIKLECRDCQCEVDETCNQDSDGNYVCNSCEMELCNNCLDGPNEIETKSGEYVCSDCYSGYADDAYEAYKDNLEYEANNG